MATERRLNVQISADARQFTRAMGQVEQTVGRAASSVARANVTMSRSFGAAAAGTQALGTQAASASRGIRSAATATQGLAGGARLMGGRLAVANRQVGLHNQAIGRSYALHNTLGGVMMGTRQRAGQMAAGVAAGTAAMSLGFKDARKNAGAMHGSFESYAGFVGFQMLGRQAMLMGTMILGAAGLSVRAFSQMEDSFALVRKTTEATEDQYKTLNAEIRQLATEAPIAVDELNQVAGVAGQLGVPTESIAEFTQIMAEMGVATNLTAEQASISFARIANVMNEGLDDEGIGRMTSAVVDLGNNMAAREDEIVRFMERGAAAGQVVGMASEDLAAFSASMAATGTRAERGGTAFQRVLFTMMEAVNAAGPEMEYMADVVGMTADEFQALWADDPAMALVEFIEGLGNAGEEANSVMTELFGNNVRITQTFLALAGAGDLTRDALLRSRDAHAANNARATEADERFSTLDSRLQMFRNRINEVAIGIGERLAPAFSAMFGFVTGAMEAFGELPDFVQNSVLALAGLSAIALIVGGNAALMVFPFQVLRGILPQLTAAWNNATGATALNAAAISRNVAVQHQATAAKSANVAALQAQARHLAIATGAQKSFAASMVSTNRLAAGAVAGTGPMSLLQGKLFRLGTTAQTAGRLIKGAGKVVAGAGVAFAKALLPIMAIYGAFKGLQWAVGLTNSGFIDSSQAVDDLAMSADIALDSLEELGEIEDPMPGFREANEEIIEGLREMDAMTRNITARRIVMEMEMRGAEPEEIEQVLRELENAVGLDLGINLDLELGQSYHETMVQFQRDMSRLSDNVGAFSSIPFIGSDQRDQVRDQATLISQMARQNLPELERAIDGTFDTTHLEAWSENTAYAFRHATDAMEQYAHEMVHGAASSRDGVLRFGNETIDTMEGIANSFVESEVVGRDWGESMAVAGAEAMAAGASTEEAMAAAHWELYILAKEAGVAEGALRQIRGVAQGMTPEWDNFTESLRNQGLALGGVDFEQAANNAQGLTQEQSALNELVLQSTEDFNMLDQSVRDIATAFTQTQDPMSVYRENLAEINAEAEDGPDVEASLEEFLKAQDEVLENEQQFRETTNDIRDRTNDDVAAFWAVRMREEPALAAELADASVEELEQGYEREQEIRTSAGRDALYTLMDAGADLVSTTGQISDDTVMALAEGLDMTEREVRDAFDRGNIAAVQALGHMNMDVETALLATVSLFEEYGDESAEEILESLRGGGSEVVDFLEDELNVDAETALDKFAQIHEAGGDEAVDLLLDNLEDADGDIAGAIEEWVDTSDGSLRDLVDVLDGAGVDGADALVESLMDKTDDVEGVGNSYAQSMKEGLNPLERMLRGVGTRLPGVAGAPRLPSSSNADGSIRGGYSFANGGTLPQSAKIQSPVSGRGLVQWAEPETHGEAFIPLAPSKRPRSIAIWRETGRRLGLEPDAAFDRGGFFGAGDVPDIPDYPWNGIDRTAHGVGQIARSGALNMIQGANEAVGGSLEAFRNLSEGGRVNIMRAAAFARGQVGKPYIWGGVGPVGYDCSGLWSAITNVARGQNPHRRLYTTASFGGGAPMGHRRGGGSPIQVGVNASGGHMAGDIMGRAYEARGRRIPVLGPGAARGSSYGTRFSAVLADGGILNDLLHEMVGSPGDIGDTSGVQNMDTIPVGSGRTRSGTKQVPNPLKDNGVQKFDKGGLLMPGVTTVVNKTGKPESVFADGGILKGLSAEVSDKVSLSIDQLVFPHLTADPMSQAGRTGSRRLNFMDVENMERILSNQDAMIAQMERQARRDDLEENLREARSEGDRDAIRDAEQRLREFEIDFVRGAWREEMDGILERQRQMQANFDEFQMSRRPDALRLEVYGDRVAALEQWTDAWLEAVNTRDQLIESELQNLNNMLEEEQRIYEEKERIEREYNESLKRLRQDRDDDEARALEQRQDALRGFFDPMNEREREWGNTARAVANNINDQVREFEEWADALDELQERGLSEEAIRALDLDDPSNVDQVKMFTRATEDEIDNLNRAVERKTRATGERTTSEQRSMFGELGDDLTEIADDFTQQQEELYRQFNEDMLEQQEAMNQIGYDSGRALSEAIADGMNSNLEAVREAARALREAQESALQSGTYVDDEGGVAPSGRSYEDEEGRLWFSPSGTTDTYTAFGPGQEEHIRRLYGDPHEGRSTDWLEDQSAGRVVDLFGPGAIDTMRSPEEQQMMPPPGRSVRDTSGRIWWDPANEDGFYSAFGPGQERETLRVYGSPASTISANWAESRQLGRVVDYFGPGVLDQMQAKTFDVGGVLPPGLTMAYNGTRRAEYVLREPRGRGISGNGPSNITVEVVNEIDGREVSRQVTKQQVREDGRVRVRQGKASWR